MTIHEAQQRLIFQLYHIYESREASNIADLVMEHITGWKKIDRILNKQLTLLQDKIEILDRYTDELLAHRPVQYVLNEAWFSGMKFFVNEHVLIPRPETEELVDWVMKAVTRTHLPKPQKLVSADEHLVVLDIGTGSGCIPVTLKKQISFADVYACDISKEALEIAQKNAAIHEVDIRLVNINFLDTSQWVNLPSIDIIISNPPYIPLKDKETMRPNVLEYEPHIALFVEDNDPLIFYRAIADFAKQKLKQGGAIYVEVHEDIGHDVQRLFAEEGLDGIELKKDMQGKDRMLRVTS